MRLWQGLGSYQEELLCSGATQIPHEANLDFSIRNNSCCRCQIKKAIINLQDFYADSCEQHGSESKFDLIWCGWLDHIILSAVNPSGSPKVSCVNIWLEKANISACEIGPLS
jgi:hypothetical protein